MRNPEPPTVHFGYFFYRNSAVIGIPPGQPLDLANVLHGADGIGLDDGGGVDIARPGTVYDVHYLGAAVGANLI